MKKKKNIYRYGNCDVNGFGWKLCNPVRNRKLGQGKQIFILKYFCFIFDKYRKDSGDIIKTHCQKKEVFYVSYDDVREMNFVVCLKLWATKLN